MLAGTSNAAQVSQKLLWAPSLLSWPGLVGQPCDQRAAGTLAPTWRRARDNAEQREQDLSVFAGTQIAALVSPKLLQRPLPAPIPPPPPSGFTQHASILTCAFFVQISTGYELTPRKRTQNGHDPPTRAFSIVILTGYELRSRPNHAKRLWML